MSNNKTKVEVLCESAIHRIDEAINKHKSGQPADLSIHLLETIRDEVEQMRQVLDPAQFQPSYGRFVIDWPDVYGLVCELTELAYQYGRLKSRGKPENRDIQDCSPPEGQEQS